MVKSEQKTYTFVFCFGFCLVLEFFWNLVVKCKYKTAHYKYVKEFSWIEHQAGPAFGIELQLAESLMVALISGVKLECCWGQKSFTWAKVAREKYKADPNSEQMLLKPLKILPITHHL